MRMTEMKTILARIEQRLAQTNQKPTAASKAAGKPDAIRNIQRAVEEGRHSTVTLETLIALAKQLDVSLEWLLFGKESDGTSGLGVNEPVIASLLEAVEGSYSMLGLDQDEASALLKIVLEAAQEPPTPSSGPGYHRLVAEIEARKYLKSRQIQDGDA